MGIKGKAKETWTTVRTNLVKRKKKGGSSTQESAALCVNK